MARPFELVSARHTPRRLGLSSWWSAALRRRFWARLRARSMLVVLAAGGYALGTLEAFAVSTHRGLFGYRERLWGSWHASGGAIGLAAVAFVVALLAAVRRAVR